MASIQLPAWAASLLAVGLPAGGWYARKLIERHWQHRDRRTVRAEADREEQLRLLRHLNGDLYQRWIWLADHPDAADRTKAEPVANEIGTWLYKHSAYFPEGYRVLMVDLGDLTFHLATEQRGWVLQMRNTDLAPMWTGLHLYQRTVEERLGID